MSFLKEFKDDLSQAVNELVDEKTTEEVVAEETAPVEDDKEIDTIGEDFSLDLDEIDSMMNEEATVEEVVEDVAEPEIEDDFVATEEVTEEVSVEEVVEEYTEEPSFQSEEMELPSDEVAEITKGTNLTGNIESDGSINLYGKVKGDITCRGKLMVTGRIEGTSRAREIFANSAKVEGDVHSEGTIKVGNGSVIIGNIYATSAVIGGAIKGDIDVKGPVIIDGTAVVQGNIKSRSVQINNGAIIDGYCSQCYADIDYKSLFEDSFATN